MVGPAITLADGDYVAQVDAEGAALTSLTHRGRELTLRVPGRVPTPAYSGLVLAPWPNRIAGGRYDFAGQSHQLPVNEVEPGNALHGLVLWETWRPVDATVSAVTFEHQLNPRPGYPFRLDLAVHYRVDGAGLNVEVEAHNVGDSAAPVGLATHPYLVADADTLLDAWSLTLPAAEVLHADENLLPSDRFEVAAAGLDYTSGRRLDDAVIDHAFTALSFDADGATSAELVDAAGRGVRLDWDVRSRWVQVYTMQLPGSAIHRRAVAIEPMTCAPDAFNSGEGLIVLEPGEQTGMGWRASAVGS